MNVATRTRFPRPVVLGALIIVAVLSACEASACDFGGFPGPPSFLVSPGPRCADVADSGSIPTETTLSPGSEPLSGDAATLAALYNATDGPNWRDNTRWLTDAPISDWSGVTASNIVNGGVVGECVVRRLDLSSNQLSGEIPAELANLSNLVDLDLRSNQLSGEIPAELGNLPNLGWLDLGFNQLSGEIPAELAKISFLILRGNQLSGEIPAELANLSNLDLSDTNLVDLDLSDNQLSGMIPIELGKIPNLRSLNLNRNQLSGEIPAELANLSNLVDLNLNRNQLSGEIPAELANLSNLVDLNLGDNQLSGEIPAELANLSNLEDLDLSSNQLSGEIPAELANLSNLKSLDLGFNQLSGEIPAELGNLPNLRSLDLGFNQLSGEIPAELGKISILILDGNQLSGRILRPNGINQQYAWDGSTILVSWDAVDGADYYKVYHDRIHDSSCSLRRDGSPVACEELAANVVGTSYLHENPSAVNYYWVVSCNSDGCSEIDSRNPAAPIEPIPAGPANVTYAVEGSAIRVTWEAVDGADYYKVYYHDFFNSCSLSTDGSPSFCEELATKVVGTAYVHTSPNPSAVNNNYWVVACNSGGCSEIDSRNPAAPIEPIPAGPVNVTYAVEGSAIRVTWDAADGADYYKVYHDESFDDNCSLSTDGSPVFCEELAANVVGTSYLHENPRAVNYWVVACNSGGCSEIDSRNPAAPIEPIPAGPVNVTYAVEGSAIRVTWEAVDGADYYKVYYDAISDSGCSLRRDGSPVVCEELAANVVGTSYLHENPSATNTYYWVVACNSGGCSEIESKNPARPR